MSEQESSGQAIRGIIRRRLLVNAVVDPDEAAARLPDGLRPHVTEQGTVVGCCLLEIDAIRPAGLPAVVGQRMRAAAHRISVEWEDASGTLVTGVYVPVRHTDSSAAAFLGGRWFPGVHERARIDVWASDSELRWCSDPLDDSGLGVRVAASIPDDEPAVPTCDAIGSTCLAAAVGVSPDRRGRLEAAHMAPSHRLARAVVISDVSSEFIDSFATAEMSTSYLMSDAEVVWTRAASPSRRAKVSA